MLGRLGGGGIGVGGFDCLDFGGGDAWNDSKSQESKWEALAVSITIVKTRGCQGSRISTDGSERFAEGLKVW